MKKVLIALIILAIVGVPYLLPMPIMTSGLVAQYERGQSIELTVTAWNIAPIDRNFSDTPKATDIVLKINGTPLANTPTHTAPRVPLFSNRSHKVTYVISKQTSDVPRFDSATGQLLLPAGEQKISVGWLGGSSQASSIRVIEL